MSLAIAFAISARPRRRLHRRRSSHVPTMRSRDPICPRAAATGGSPGVEILAAFGGEQHSDSGCWHPTRANSRACMSPTLNSVAVA
jgi:hypothetical protein